MPRGSVPSRGFPSKYSWADFSASGASLPELCRWGVMPYTPILATLAYVLSPDGGRVLMIHRNARPDDPAFGKYNGLGGKLEAEEDVVEGLRRELREEANLEVEEAALRGTISWPGFGKRGEDWFGFLFLVTKWSGE